MTDGHSDSSEPLGSTGDTGEVMPVHAKDASASVLALLRFSLRYGSDMTGVEMEERKVMLRGLQL